jgi:predicted nuclease of predicted toxin-antitoxin system
MRFLVDAQLPPALARCLAAAGHEAEHVAEAGLGDAQDEAIWEHAVRAGSVIVSKDSDFAGRTILGQGGPPVVWISCGTRARANCSFGSKRCFRESLKHWSGESILSRLRKTRLVLHFERQLGTLS